MDTPTDTPPAASTSLSHDSLAETSLDTQCASNRLKRPRGDAAASGRCSVCQMDLHTENNDRRSFLFQLEKLNLVSTDPKVTVLRRAVVLWLAPMVNELQFSPTTLHTAVNYLDRILATARVPQERLLEVSAACLLIAGKFEETSHATPFISDIVRAAGNVEPCRADPTGTLHAAALARAELVVLQHLGWRCRVSTRLHFLELFRARGLFLPSDTIAARALSPAHRAHIDKYALFFCNLAIQDPALIHFPSSVAAAAAVACARDVAGVADVWPAALAETLCPSSSAAREEQLAACYAQMCATFRRGFDQPAGKREGFGCAFSREARPPPQCAEIETPVVATQRAGVSSATGEEEGVAPHSRPLKRMRTAVSLSIVTSLSTTETMAATTESPALIKSVVTSRASLQALSSVGSPANVVLAMDKWAFPDCV